MKKINLIICFLATVIMFAGCQKGDTGPQGPQGNANVTGITVTVSSSSQWTWNNGYYYYDVNTPALTQNILNTGSVEVFLNLDGTSNDWIALPYTDITGSTNLMWLYTSTLDNVRVFFAWNNGAQDGDPNTYYGSSIVIKVVCIASYAKAIHPHTNWKDWNQVNDIIQEQNTIQTPKLNN